MGSADGGLAEGNALPSAFALFLVQVMFIICLAKILGFVLRPLRQPAVVGEMLAGIVLGP
jgi:Kef-type K+ transport system membrane component KefB